jgi:hypothetical protein
MHIGITHQMSGPIRSLRTRDSKKHRETGSFDALLSLNNGDTTN